MEDISTLIWIGIGIFWFLTRLIRRGAKKVTETQKKRQHPSASRTTIPHKEAPRSRIESQPGPTFRGDKSPPPIVPR